MTTLHAKAKAVQHLTVYRYAERVGRMAVTSSSLRRLDARPIPDGPDEIRLFVAARDEEIRFPFFLQYYRHLGVDRFFVIDNGSTDRTTDLLVREPDVHVFRTEARFAYKGAWLDLLLHRYGRGRWCVVVDTDELLTWPHASTVSLRSLCKFLEEHGHDAFPTLLLDMYPDALLETCHYTAGQDPLDVAPLFEVAHIQESPWPSSRMNWRSPTAFYVGGVRKRVFGVEPCLSKIALLRFSRSHLLGEGAHVIDGANASSVRGASLHFKFLGDFGARVVEGAPRRLTLDPFTIAEHTAYLERLEKEEEVDLRSVHSQRYAGVDQLVELGVMASSPAFDAYAGRPSPSTRARARARASVPSRQVCGRPSELPVPLVTASSSTKLGVSVVVCAHNSAQRIGAVLAHLARVDAKGTPWEVVVIDNASTDATARTAISAWPKDAPAPLRVVAEPKLGLMNARYRALAEATYEIISFVDDDNWVGRNWVTLTSETMAAHPDVAACGGPTVAAAEIKIPEWFEQQEGTFAVGSKPGRGAVEYLWGAGLGIRRDTWRALVEKGFAPVLVGRRGAALSSGEDVELGLAFRLAGWRLWYEPELRLQHFMPAVRLDWNYLCRLKFQVGYADTLLEPYRLILQGKSETVHTSWHRGLAHSVRRAAEAGPAALRDEMRRPALMYWSGRADAYRRERRRYRELTERLREAPWRASPLSGRAFPERADTAS